MSEQIIELLFFDTFAHDNTEEINLDLVQFPKPVYVTEVRIIPLGARVQADFPGGVRLGATNPSQFDIEFFVNDLGKPGASSFETLGGFKYDQNGCINLECTPEETVRKIPTDGLVLKGWYTTITLAVYGTLTNNITEPIVQPVANPSLPTQPNTIADAQQICVVPPVETEWQPEAIPTVPVEYSAQPAAPYQAYNPPEQYVQDFEYYPDVPKDPRSYHHTPETEWETKPRPRVSDTERDRSRESTYQKPAAPERDHVRSEPARSSREKRYSRSESRDQERQQREYREADAKEEADWPDHDRQDYRSERNDHDWSDRDRDRGHDRDRDRSERCYKHDDNYRRSYNRGEDREERKRPRTPPMQSPKRPHTPQVVENVETVEAVQSEVQEAARGEKVEECAKSPGREAKDAHTPPAEEPAPMGVEEFEPILSDEDILDDGDHYQDLEYDYSTYTNNDDIIKLFVPGTTPLSKYPKAKSFTIKNNSIVIDDCLKTAIGIADDYFKSSITKYVLGTFHKLNTEIKEEFIHLCEKVTPMIGSSAIFCSIAKLYVDTKSMNPQSLSAQDKELTEQVLFIVETLVDWLKVALSYEMALIQDQPAYKTRHIKCGVRLADWCCNSIDFVRLLWQNDFNVPNALLNLYDQEFMALSIKLMILKALDTYLQHKFAIEKFLLGGIDDSICQNGFNDSTPVPHTNGYKVLVGFMLQQPLARVKFALTSILKKLNLYEILHKMHSILIKLRDVSHDISAEEINLITKSLNEVLNYCRAGPFVLSQPKRFLPVSSQFEIMRNYSYNVLVVYFKMFNLLQCFVLLLNYPSTMNLPLIKTPIFEIISILLDKSEGLEYLSENVETITVLLKCLLRTDEEMQYSAAEFVLKSHQLGLKIAYKLQALYHVEFLTANGKLHNLDCDAPEIIDHLHGLLCLTFSHFGKVSCAETLGLEDNIRCLLQFLEPVLAKEKTETFVGRLKDSVGIPYIVDLVLLAVATVSNIPILEKQSKVLLHLVNQQDVFEDSVCLKLSELRLYLAPLENVTKFAYDDISLFVEAVDKSVENLPYTMSTAITALRIIQHLGISKHQPSSSDNPISNFVELKYKHVILQLFSLEGTTILSKVLQKICDHFEQPSLHSSFFVSQQGWCLLQVIHPAVLLLKQMLAYAIQCQNTNFKDLTAISVFLQTHNLLSCFPRSCAGYGLAQEVSACIVEALLVYTQPVSEQISEKDSLTKALWTQMCGEVIKFVTFSPHTFLSGLLVFSELLPLPLPIQTRDEHTAEEVSWVINLRKLWSAHLHPHSAIIQDMVNKLCISTQPQLLNLLRRVCVQISDLSANSALMIARGVLDNVYDALIPKEDVKMGPCNAHIARLLNFLACLVTHNTIKCAVLHLMHTNSTVTLKTEERYVSLIQAFSQVLKNESTSNSHIQSQECVLSIIQSFCDVEITLSQNTGITSEEYLANALPVKEHLLMFIHMIWEHLTTDNSFVTCLPIFRTLLMLTEHDYGFYHLKEHLLKKNDAFLVLLEKLANNFSKSIAECLSTLNILVEFLRVCVTTDVAEESLLYTPRKMTLSVLELKKLIGWRTDGKPENHPLLSLETILKAVVEEDNTFENFLEDLTSLLKLLDGDSSDTNKEMKDTCVDTVLPVPESLLIQFSRRTIFSSSDACDERLTANYWLAIPAVDGETDSENVQCDIIEICRQNLRPEYNLVREVEKLCRISRTDGLDDKEKRLEDEDKMKKPFVTPMRARGFARTVPQRPDLFRSRPPNTSRPPSLHVDDFVALETCGAQPTGPTGYNKISRELLASTRVARVTRGRAFVNSERSVQYRQMPWWGAGMGRGPY
nr:protein virilizer [Leptinotarsa decemlineata]